MLAASAAGAGAIAITGLRTDARRLTLARALGADLSYEVDDLDLPAALAADGFVPDVVVDASAHATQPILDAIKGAHVGGRIVLAGIKGDRPIPGFLSDRVVFRELSLLGVRSASWQAFDRAIALLPRRVDDLSPLHDAAFGLHEAAHAVEATAGGEGREMLGVMIRP